MSANLTRRRFLTTLGELSAGTALAAIGTSVLAQQRTVLESNHGAELNVSLLDGQPAYNGKVPGPTFRVLPGQNLDVTLVNNLPPLHDDCTPDVNSFHGLHTTNLHTHGLHVSPTTDSSGNFEADNVLLSVVPEGQIVLCETICGEPVAKSFRKQTAKYRFELPANHPPGTFWYHAHKHGSTQSQVGAGLAGPLIVPDPPGLMPDYIAEADEKILMLMNAGVVEVDPDGGGIVQPILKLRRGEVQRWRIINAQTVGNTFAYLRTNIPDLEFYQIAFDGLTLNQRVEIDQYNAEEPWNNPAAMAPGNRMDLIVRVPDTARPRSFGVGIGQAFKDLINLDGIGGETNSVELSIEILDEKVDRLWSDDPSLPGSGLKPFPVVPQKKRTFDFTPGFTVDGDAFDGEVKHTLRRGDEEEWTFQNSTGGVHAFHIHVNPFFVTHVNGVELPEDSPLRRWQDTVALPFASGGAPGSITCRSRFETFTGKFVLHCHVLRHEDLGMMQVVEII